MRSGIAFADLYHRRKPRDRSQVRGSDAEAGIIVLPGPNQVAARNDPREKSRLRDPRRQSSQSPGFPGVPRNNTTTLAPGASPYVKTT